MNLKALFGDDTTDLVILPQELTTKDNQLIHPEALKALQNLYDIAKEQGYPFKVISSYRSYDYQRSIWNNKFEGLRPVYDINGNCLQLDKLNDLEKIEAIMLFSALPGASRHHWGTDFDIFPAEPIEAGYKVKLQPSEFYDKGVAAKFNQFISPLLEKQDFFRPYEIYKDGVAAEPWHISYKPLADNYLKTLKLKNLRKKLAVDSVLAGNETIIKNLDHLYKRFVINIC